MTIGITHINIDLSRVPNFKAALDAAVHRGVGRAAVVFEGAAKSAIGGKVGGAGVGPGKVWNVRSMPGSFPNSQSGQLVQNITSEPDGYARFLVGTNLAHGKYMEFGSHPRAKKGKFLAIPLNYEASRIQKRAGPAGLRSVPGLVILRKTRRGFLLGFRGREAIKEASKTLRAKKNAAYLSLGASARTAQNEEAMFALVPDVTILARPWLLPTMANSGNQAEAVKVFGDTIRAAINGAVVGGVKAAAQ